MSFPVATQAESGPHRNVVWKIIFGQSHPKYWLLALILLICRLMAKLPYPALVKCGSAFGRLIFMTARKARNIASTNLRLCFPDQSDDEHYALLHDSFSELGISIAETLVCWFGDADALYEKKISIEGLEYWQEALERDKGIILLSCHYGSPDLNAFFLSRLARDKTFIFTYRRPSDEVINQILTLLRRKISPHSCPVQCLRSVVHALKRKNVVWCAPDIEVCETQGVFADFMGVPTVTSVLAGRLSQITGAVVLPCAHYRNKNNQSYTLKLFPAMTDFPSSCPADDAQTQNSQVEKILAPQPERYWWVIKRFKRRPEGEQNVY